jgi:hypothetical protein
MERSLRLNYLWVYSFLTKKIKRNILLTCIFALEPRKYLILHPLPPPPTIRFLRYRGRVTLTGYEECAQKLRAVRQRRRWKILCGLDWINSAKDPVASESLSYGTDISVRVRVSQSVSQSVSRSVGRSGRLGLKPLRDS